MKTIAQDLTVWIAVAAWQRIAEWVRLAGDYEVSGLGLVEQRRDTRGRLVGFEVTDVFLPEQENGHASTELTPESVAKLMLEVEDQTGASEKLRFWWHYHPGKIGLMWSGTDDQCVDELHNGDWFVSTVFDPTMDCRTRVDLYQPLRVTLDQVTTRIYSADPQLVDECAALFRARVSRRQVVTLGPGRPSQASRSRAIGDVLGLSHQVFGRDRVHSAEELLLVQEALETGEMSYAEYLTLVDDAGLFGADDGWFGDVSPDGQHEPLEDKSGD